MIKRSGGTLTLVGCNYCCDGTWAGNTSCANDQLYHIGSPDVGDEVGIHPRGVN